MGPEQMSNHSVPNRICKKKHFSIPSKRIKIIFSVLVVAVCGRFRFFSTYDIEHLEMVCPLCFARSGVTSRAWGDLQRAYVVTCGWSDLMRPGDLGSLTELTCTWWWWWWWWWWGGIRQFYTWSHVPCCGTIQSCTVNCCTIYYNYLSKHTQISLPSRIKSLHCSGQTTHHQRWSTGSCARQMQDPTNVGPEGYWQQMLPTSQTHFSQISRA